MNGLSLNSRDVLLFLLFAFDAAVQRSHMFSAHQFNNHVRVVIHQELGRIDALLDAAAHSAKGQSTVNLPELFFRYTLSSFSKMAFSADLDCLSADPACLERPVPFAVAFDYAQVRFSVPLLLRAPLGVVVAHGAHQVKLPFFFPNF